MKQEKQKSKNGYKQNQFILQVKFQLALFPIFIFQAHTMQHLRRMNTTKKYQHSEPLHYIYIVHFGDTK